MRLREAKGLLKMHSSWTWGRILPAQPLVLAHLRPGYSHDSQDWPRRLLVSHIKSWIPPQGCGSYSPGWMGPLDSRRPHRCWTGVWSLSSELELGPSQCVQQGGQRLGGGDLSPNRSWFWEASDRLKKPASSGKLSVMLLQGLGSQYAVSQGQVLAPLFTTSWVHLAWPFWTCLLRSKLGVKSGGKEENMQSTWDTVGSQWHRVFHLFQSVHSFSQSFNKHFINSLLLSGLCYTQRWISPCSQWTHSLVNK